MKNTWRHWVDGKGYYFFKSFRVYWAYREYLTDIYTTTFKPTGFEAYIIENGFKQVAGKQKEFSTYDNCGRCYEDSMGNICTVGLFGQPTRIGITYPDVYDYNGCLFTNIPVESDYKFYLDQILITK